jgi:hypothetical protein
VADEGEEGQGEEIHGLAADTAVAVAGAAQSQANSEPPPQPRPLPNRRRPRTRAIGGARLRRIYHRRVPRLGVHARAVAPLRRRHLLPEQVLLPLASLFLRG